MSGLLDKKLRIGISSCLLGNAVRYDGGSKGDELFISMSDFVEWLPVCPEVHCGLSVPREPMRLVKNNGMLRLSEIRSGIDHTEMLLNWIRIKFVELDNAGLCGFVFKSRSPSCALRDAELYDSAGLLAGITAGIFAEAFVKKFSLLPVEDDVRLHDPDVMKEFLRYAHVNKDVF